MKPRRTQFWKDVFAHALSGAAGHYRGAGCGGAEAPRDGESVSPALTFALRVWRVDRDRATSRLCRSWPEAARAALEIYRSGLGPIVELVPCVETMGLSVPLVSAAGIPWHSSERLTTLGRVDEDGGVWCDPPGLVL